MKKFLLFGVFMTLAFMINAQTQVYVLDFETAGGYSTSMEEQTDGGGDYFIRTDGTNISESFTNKQGSYFFAANDIDADGMSSPATLTIDDINIAGYSNLEIRVYLAEGDDGSDNDWDADDNVHIDFDIDNSGSFTNGIWIENNGATYNSAPFIDTDYDGTGDGTEITDAFIQFTKSLGNTGAWLDIKITFNGLDSGDEDIAIDHIEVYGTPISIEDNNNNSCDLYGDAASGSVWIEMMNGSNIVMAINPNGQDLGTLYIQMRDAGTTIEEYLESGTADKKKTLPRFFDLSSDNPLTSAVTVRLYYTDAELTDFNNSTLGSGASSFAISDLKITHYDGPDEDCDFSNNTGGTSTLITPTAIAVDGGFYLEFDVSSFSELVASEPIAAPLPIDLTSFTATQRNNQVAVTWTTATEINNDFFNVERSKDGQRFDVIGQVAGAGNSTTTQKYEFIDNTPMRGTNYYRLTQTDFDGQSETFDVVSVDFDGKVNVSVAPTQVTNTLTLSLEPMKTTGRVTIFNLVGQKVYDNTIGAGTSSMEINATGFARGQYFARVSNGSLVETVRFIKQ